MLFSYDTTWTIDYGKRKKMTLHEKKKKSDQFSSNKIYTLPEDYTYLINLVTIGGKLLKLITSLKDAITQMEKNEHNIFITNILHKFIYYLSA